MIMHWLRLAFSPRYRALIEGLNDLYPLGQTCCPKTDEQLEAEAQLFEDYGDTEMAAILRSLS